MLIYCDSVILIYLLDAADSFHHRAVARMGSLRAAGDHIAVSDLARLECRGKPIQLGESARLQKFDTFFALPDVTKVSLTPAVYDRAAQIRALHAFKTLDAIHLAAAVEARCDAFLTHDMRLTRFQDLVVELLP
jgi:predicted nucleic acid-binding protein